MDRIDLSLNCCKCDYSGINAKGHVECRHSSLLESERELSTLLGPVPDWCPLKKKNHDRMVSVKQQVNDPFIYYKEGYKYQLTEDYHQDTGIFLISDIGTDYIILTTDGHLFTKKGYAWDGPSGPAFDTLTFMRASLEHDAFYNLMRLNLLFQSYRPRIDRRMRDVCIEDGMSRIRAWWCYRGVRRFAAPAAYPENAKVIHSAPVDD